MVSVRINEDELVEMLVDRLNHWDVDDDIKDLYRKMYENLAYGGCFDGAELDVMSIVDNDYINYCYVYSEGDEEFEDWRNGEADFDVEAESDDGKMILVRW